LSATLAETGFGALEHVVQVRERSRLWGNAVRDAFDVVDDRLPDSGHLPDVSVVCERASDIRIHGAPSSHFIRRIFLPGTHFRQRAQVGLSWAGGHPMAPDD
jgi:hypothetical protein